MSLWDMLFLTPIERKKLKTIVSFGLNKYKIKSSLFRKEHIMAYQIFTDSSSGLSKELRAEYNIPYFRMGIVIDGVEKHADLDWEEYTNDEFYGWVANPKIKRNTSLISTTEIIEKVTPYLKEGKDILYLACTDALSGSRNIFELVKKDLEEQFPGRKLISVNSCRAEMALGMIVIEACKLQRQGKSIEEVVAWVEENKQKFNQVGSVETLTYLKAFGRVSGAAAFFGNLMSLKPMIMADIHGNNYVYKKTKGTKNSLEESILYIKERMIEGVTDCVYVCQASCSEKQKYLMKQIEEQLHIKAYPSFIGPLVGLCCGPGMFGCYFFGKEVTEEAK